MELVTESRRTGTYMHIQIRNTLEETVKFTKYIRYTYMALDTRLFFREPQLMR